MSKPLQKNWTVYFDHAAVATREHEKLKRVLSILGLVDCGSEDIPSQGVVTHFLKPSPSAPAVEILEIVDPQGVVAKFIDKKGPGIHHLSFRVSALDELSNELRAQGIRLVYEKSMPGAHKTWVNFIHPESTGGVLIEISEKTP